MSVTQMFLKQLLKLFNALETLYANELENALLQRSMRREAEAQTSESKQQHVQNETQGWCLCCFVIDDVKVIIFIKASFLEQITNGKDELHWTHCFL